MEQTTKLADRIRQAIPRVPSASLRFWGEWFGRPYQNLHKLMRCAAEQNILRLSFDQGETLSVWSPTGLTINQSTLRISDADGVRWEWFAYGRAKTQANLYFEDFMKSAEGISASTNIDWYAPEFRLTTAEAAVEFLSLTVGK